MRRQSLLILALALGSAVQANAEVTSSEGKALFEKHCSKCHGVDGRGGGPAAATLKIRPVDLTRIADRRSGVWPMLEVMSIIDGYTKSTNPRQDMPVITELTEGPIVNFDTGNGLETPIPARLIAVAVFLESIQSPKPERYVP